MKSAALTSILLATVTICFSVANAGETPDFLSEVRPILSDHCFACHGPDQHERAADLRLDTADGIANVVVAMSSGDSDLVHRIESDDEYTVMPPPEYNKPLTESEKKILRNWIDAGAEFKGHWAFDVPTKVETDASTSEAIDYFIERKLETFGLAPNAQAPDAALLRRVCLDLTGLPPTREQIERLEQGNFDYERLVDELLASPAFGQHFGRHWLDLVRYADTHGLHLDNYREMWPYRDWVVDAVNRNVPFDQFVTEQLAGDLLPEATLDQQIASGFNRLNVTTSEGGSIYEEVFARNVIDRTDAFGTIFLGLTTQCAVCHDHKFDPISQKDYYSLSAFFNSLDGRALDGNAKDHPPVVRVPNEKQVAQLDAYAAELKSLQAEMAAPIQTVDEAQREWERELLRLAADEQNRSDESTKPPAVIRSRAFLASDAHASSGATLTIEEDFVRSLEPAKPKDTHTFVGTIPKSTSTENSEPELDRWQLLRLIVLPDPQSNRPGVSSNGNAVLTEIRIASRKAAGGPWQSIPITAASADVEQADGDFAVSFAIDGETDDAKGWAVDGHRVEGGRTATFAVPELVSRIKSGHQQLKVELLYQSRYAAHQFYGVRFEVSNEQLAGSVIEKVKPSPVHSIGPFSVESTPAGISRKFASEAKAFDSKADVQYQGESFSWKVQDQWAPVAVQTLPGAKSGVSVNLIHQALDSPKKQEIELLLGTTDAHVVTLNDKRVGQVPAATNKLRPLSKTYRLELKKGTNDLYIKTVSQQSPIQLTYAYRSSQISQPSSILKLLEQPIEQPIQEPIQQRRQTDEDALRVYYREVITDHPDWLALKAMAKGIESATEKLQKAIPTTLTWKETKQPREAKVLIRGQYDQPGETVNRDVPSFLPDMDASMPRDRLGLSQWLMSDEHPLTSRVAVNRFWQSIFGTGLVRSSEDFGNQGEPPSHPQLLDWLAVDFRENGWDVKRLVKQMVMSRAYRRDASISEDQLTLDPENQLYARGPRHRLDAEVLRDQALSLAGLLNPEAGGPSVKPPQPKGLWYAVGYTRSNTANFKADAEPEKQFRRSVYIFWKRTSAPPQMSTFDAPSRESCTARRERTNTPLQALLLMNESQYLQAAKHLAIRALRECGSETPKDRVAWMMQTATARSPRPSEVEALASLLKGLKSHYGSKPEDAKALLSVDDLNAEDFDDADLAAWMMAASTVLNLDEVVNK